MFETRKLFKEVDLLFLLLELFLKHKFLKVFFVKHSKRGGE